MTSAVSCDSVAGTEYLEGAAASMAVEKVFTGFFWRGSLLARPPGMDLRI
jgi:hypothetical protein